MQPQPLFASVRLADAMQNLQSAARAAVERMSPAQLSQPDLEALVSSIAGALAITAPRLADDNDIATSPCTRTNEVDDYGRQITVTENCLEVFLPFTGDRNGFFQEPSQRSLNLPEASIGSNELSVVLPVEGLTAEQVTAEIKGLAALLRSHLETLARDAHRINGQVTELVRALLVKRSAELKQRDALLADLPFKVRKR